MIVDVTIPCAIDNIASEYFVWIKITLTSSFLSSVGWVGYAPPGDILKGDWRVDSSLLRRGHDCRCGWALRSPERGRRGTTKLVPWKHKMWEIMRIINQRYQCAEKGLQKIPFLKTWHKFLTICFVLQLLFLPGQNIRHFHVITVIAHCHRHVLNYSESIIEAISSEVD